MKTNWGRHNKIWPIYDKILKYVKMRNKQREAFVFVKVFIIEYGKTEIMQISSMCYRDVIVYTFGVNFQRNIITEQLEK